MTEASACWFHRLDDDAIVCLFDHLTIPDIIAFRQCCRWMWYLSCTRTIWLNAYKTHILKSNTISPGAFDHLRLQSQSPMKLARCVILAYRRSVMFSTGAQNQMSVESKILIAPNRAQNIRCFGHIQDDGLRRGGLLQSGGKVWLVTQDRHGAILVRNCPTLRFVGCWSLPQNGHGNWRIVKTTFHTNKGSDPVIAVHSQNKVQKIFYLMTLTPSGRLEILSHHHIRGIGKLIAVHGDNLALCLRGFNQSVIIRNWKTQEQCELHYPGKDKYLLSVKGVFFLPQIVIVVRKYSASVYASPTLKPLQGEMLVHKPCSTLQLRSVSAAFLSWHQNGALPTLLVLDAGVWRVLSVINVPSNSQGITTTEHAHNLVPALTMGPSMTRSSSSDNAYGVSVGQDGTFIEAIPIYYEYLHGRALKRHALQVVSLPEHLDPSGQFQIKASHLFRPFFKVHYNSTFGIMALISEDGVELFNIVVKADNLGDESGLMKLWNMI